MARRGRPLFRLCDPSGDGVPLTEAAQAGQTDDSRASSRELTVLPGSRPGLLHRAAMVGVEASPDQSGVRCRRIQFYYEAFRQRPYATRAMDGQVDKE